MTTCQYCPSESAPIYDRTCLSCTAVLMRPFTEAVILRRLAIVVREHGEGLARILREAIEAARKASPLHGLRT